MWLVIAVFALILLSYWLSKVAQVVSMKDSEFDGHNDKLIMFMLVFFGSFFGAIGFDLWNWSRLQRLQREKSEKQLVEAMKKTGEKAGRETD